MLLYGTIRVLFQFACILFLAQKVNKTQAVIMMNLIMVACAENMIIFNLDILLNKKKQYY